MKKKIITTLLILVLCINSAFTIGFGFHAIDIRTSPEFSSGVFPTSLLYQFDFPIPDIISGNTTEFDFRLDNGIDFRTLRQDPMTALPFAGTPDKPEWNYPKDYITIFDEMNLVFGQGFFKTSKSDKDTLKFWASFDIRFENAYERLDYLNDPKNTEGLFMKAPKYDENPSDDTFTAAIPRFENCSWIGQPELDGSRSTTNFSLSFGLDFNMMKDKITRRDGFKNSFWFRINPTWMDFFGSGSQDFMIFWNKLDLAQTVFHVDQHGERDTTWLSLVLDNSTTYRYIMGTKIPYYIQGGDIYGAKALNTEHVITNRSSLTFYGPQINSYDCYPYLSAFVDLGFSFGKMLNSPDSKSYFDMVASVGVRAEMIIFNFANFYYEVGYVMENTLDMSPTPITRIGFSFGV